MIIVTLITRMIFALDIQLVDKQTLSRCTFYNSQYGTDLMVKYNKCLVKYGIK